MSIRLGQNEVQNYLNITTYESNINPDNFYTKEEVNSLISGIQMPSLTGYAKETYVDQKVSDLVNSAPETLNTLGELAAAITENDGLLNGLNLAITNKADKSTLNSYALKTELFSKDYNELTNKPTLFSGSYTDLTNKPTIPSLDGYATEQWVEDKLENLDIGSGEINVDLSEYAKKTELFSKDYNDLTNKPDLSKLEEIKENESDIVFSTQEVTGAENLRSITINDVSYNVAAETPEVDLTGLATETYVDTKIANLVNSAPGTLDTLGELATALQTHDDEYDALLETVGNKANKSELFSKNYNDLTNKPTIPNIVYSSTQPSSPTTGMIWLEPV